MMKPFSTFCLLLFFNLAWAQNEGYWKQLNNAPDDKAILSRFSGRPKIFELNIEELKQQIQRAPQHRNSARSAITVSFPDAQGKFQQFRIYRQSHLSPELQARYPEISSFYGESTEGKSSKIYFAVSPLGLYAMQLKLGEEAVFTETLDNSRNLYRVYRPSDRSASRAPFHCSTQKSSSVQGLSFSRIFNADDATLRTYRLALSCTGEYAQYFGGTKALALAAMNNSLTRINGIFENDLAIRMVLIPEQENIIFTDPATDPYSDAAIGADGAWSTELMGVLNGNRFGIGNAAFDIGHLFGATGGGGNAGCIGCVCNNSTRFDPFEGTIMYKGQAYSSPADGIPSGDSFDVDYAAHEMGHQFGADHTFSHRPEGTEAQVEPGSGSTIMGYAGITTQDVQTHSDPYFHAVSIEQISTYVRSSKGNCSTNTPTRNAAPRADAGADFTIPQNTPFMLTGKATDADGDALTFAWEQMDVQNTSGNRPASNRLLAPLFRSLAPTNSSVRYFPQMSTLLKGGTQTLGPITRWTTNPIAVEILPTVSRKMNFRLTVRDNKANGGASGSDHMVVTVDAAYGPLRVTSQNIPGLSYPQKARVLVTWEVAQTNFLAEQVDLLFSSDAGLTWTALAEKVPNDGSHVVVIPNVLSKKCRLMVKGAGNIFFNINAQDFEVTPEENKPLTLAPNPVKGNTLYIQNRWDLEEFEIYDASGRFVRKGKTVHNGVNVSGLMPGLYFLKLDDTTKRFIKE